MNVTVLQHIAPWEWPEGAGELILAALRDPDRKSEERSVAIDLAGDVTVINDEIAEQLLSIVQDASEAVALRSSAAVSLGPALEEAETEGFDDGIGEPAISQETFDRIKKVLRASHDDQNTPKLLRRRALEASVRAVQDWLKPALLAAYAQDDEEWKLTAVFGMRWVRGFDNEIREMLKNRNPEILCEAIRAAGNWELDEAWPVVSSLLQSSAKDKDLLLAAIDAAADLRPEEAEELLIEWTDSDDEEIAGAAREALSMAGFEFGEADAF